MKKNFPNQWIREIIYQPFIDSFLKILIILNEKKVLHFCKTFFQGWAQLGLNQ